MKWTKGRPPAKSGWYLLQMSTGDVVAGEVYRWTGDHDTHWRLDIDGDSDHLEGGNRDYIERHYGPVKRPPKVK